MQIAPCELLIKAWSLETGYESLPAVGQSDFVLQGFFCSLPATQVPTVTILYKIWYKGTKTCNKRIFHLFLDDSHNESLILFATFNWHTYISNYICISDRGFGNTGCGVFKGGYQIRKLFA